MGGISNFVSKKSREENIIGHFSKICEKATTKKEVRQIEMRLLKPKPIQPYRGKKTGLTAFQKKSLLLVFKTPKPIKELSKIIRINSYVNNNTYDTAFLLELINLINSGRIVWDDKKNKYYLNTKKGRRLRI